jgi:hypothetical protein
MRIQRQRVLTALLLTCMAAGAGAAAAAALTDPAAVSASAAALTDPAVAVAAALTDPAAVIVQVSGRVEVQRAGRMLPAVVGTGLEHGDRVVVAAGARAVVMYRTGRFETVTAATAIEAREIDRPSGLYRQTLQTIAQVATTDAARQPNRQGMIRPVPGQATGIAPRNDVTVLDVRPSFVWFRVADAAGYTVQLQRTDVPGARPVRFDAGRDTVWNYPAAAPPLVPGATYRWSVAANDRVAEPHTFRVISGAAYAALADAIAAIAAGGADPGAEALFVVALRYRDAGLFYEAERALARMTENGSGTGRAFHLLRGEVYDRIGALESASLAFQAADREPGL